MTPSRFTTAFASALALATAFTLTLSLTTAQAADKPLPAGVTRVPAKIDGGFETVGQDRGRPIILIASALGVTSEIFRDAFSNVHPAAPGSGGPTGDEARKNKKVLMDALGKHGITNDRLDEVSNRYRYNRGSGELWKHQEATVNALVKDGKVIGYEVVDAGYGYSSEPTISVPGATGGSAKVEVQYTKDFETNGSIKAVN